jgi:phosphoribosylaminoimidazole-succinocarboxamide synthase
MTFSQDVREQGDFKAGIPVPRAPTHFNQSSGFCETNMSQEKVLLEAVLPDCRLLGRGKVRDIYEVGEHLLIIATDRISAFDYILASGIPDKGKVLTQLSLFWFEFFQGIVPNHLVGARMNDFPSVLHPYASALEGRSMLVLKAQPLPIECVVRGYLSGSGWKDYQKNQSVCGNPLPAGLVESSRLPQPLFTPSTKATTGHDENIPFEKVVEIIGNDLANQVRSHSLQIYTKAAEYAAQRGIIIADTKFEFGLFNGELILIDEVLTPDSSRFWPAAEYQAGRAQKSFDKQFVRDYLEEIRWNKQPPAPALPEWVVEGTRQKYREAYVWLTGKPL